MRGTWQTTDGGGLGDAVLAVLAVLAVAAIAGPVLAAVAELVHVLLIVVAVLAAIGATGLVAYIALRVRHRRQETPRVVHRITPAPPAPSPSLTGPRPALERSSEVHLHLHGVSPEDIAAAIRHVQRHSGD